MISIVASSDLTPTPELIAVITGLIGTARKSETIGYRANAAGAPASQIEYLTWVIARSVGRPTQIFKPASSRKVFERDYQMVDSSRLIVAFFRPGREMQGGTAHVVKAAIDRGVEVEAYSFDESGELILLGSETGSSMYHSRPDVLQAIAEMT